MLSKACNVCGGETTRAVVDLADVPVACNVPAKSRADALDAARADIRLRFCLDCQHLFNGAFDPECMHYSGAYENALDFSPRFQAYMTGLVTDLVAQHGISGVEIVELGCGQGVFLEALCEAGNNRGLGLDPGYRGAERSERVRYRREPFSGQLGDGDPSLVCCRHALEHVAAPVEFLKDLHTALAGKDTLLFFEVPNSLYTLRELGIWDLIYEHVSYFSSTSLAGAFELAGFSVQAVSEQFGGQFLTITARPGGESSSQPMLDLGDDVALFAQRFEAKVAHWQKRLEDSQATVLWGGGSKGVTFLNVVPNGQRVQQVVDLNPRKHGSFVPGCGQPFVAPESLPEAHPDRVVVMNPNYEAEISSALTSLGLQCAVEVA